MRLASISYEHLSPLFFVKCLTPFNKDLGIEEKFISQFNSYDTVAVYFDVSLPIGLVVDVGMFVRSSRHELPNQGIGWCFY